MIYSTIYQPGNGTRYAIVWGTVGGGEPFVALPDFGKAATMTPYPAEHLYVAEKLGISEADAKHVFDAIRQASYTTT
jgi:hypothetical protein